MSVATGLLLYQVLFWPADKTTQQHERRTSVCLCWSVQPAQRPGMAIRPSEFALRPLLDWSMGL